MKYDFDPNLPIYLQVMTEIKKEIFTKISMPGQKIASVRDLALKYTVNPNTIQKALSELEREGLLYSERAVGRYVTNDEELILQKKQELLETIVTDFIKQMQDIGCDSIEISNVITKITEKK